MASEERTSQDICPAVIVLMTAHNRRERTVACLESLGRQRGVLLRVVLNDDGSTDGTADAARAFPFVHLVEGTGSDYWAGGMRRAWSAADFTDTDAVLLLNDDVVLDDDALSRLMTCLSTDDRALWGGSVRDPDSGQVTYGGYSAVAPRRRLKLRLVAPRSHPVPCDVLNGNILLLSTILAGELGGLSPHYTHGMADFELSWRAARLGVPSLVAPGTYGTCAKNSLTGTWRDPTAPLRTRWKRLTSPTGLPPREYLRVARTYGGPLWIVDALAPYVKVLVRRAS